MEEKYLAHHGVKGQKWGVIRYQNSDGTLNAAGRKHANKSYSKILNKTDKQLAWAKRDAFDAQKKIDKYEYKSAKLARKGKSLSLKDSENKAQAEKDYSVARNKIEHGTNFTNKVINNANSDGYDVFVKEKRRNVTKASEYVATVASYVAVGFAGTYFYLDATKHITGTQYNVK